MNNPPSIEQFLAFYDYPLENATVRPDGVAMIPCPINCPHAPGDERVVRLDLDSSLVLRCTAPHCDREGNRYTLMHIIKERRAPANGKAPTGAELQAVVADWDEILHQEQESELPAGLRARYCDVWDLDPELTDQKLQREVKAKRKEGPQRLRLRTLFDLLLRFRSDEFPDGINSAEIARRLGEKPATIRKIKERWSTSGTMLVRIETEFDIELDHSKYPPLVSESYIEGEMLAINWIRNVAIGEHSTDTNLSRSGYEHLYWADQLTYIPTESTENDAVNVTQSAQSSMTQVGLSEQYVRMNKASLDHLLKSWRRAWDIFTHISREQDD